MFIYLHEHWWLLNRNEDIESDKTLVRQGEITLNLIKDRADIIASFNYMNCRIGYLKNLFKDKNIKTLVISY